MTVYLINIVLILGFGFVFIHVNPSESKKKIYFGIDQAEITFSYAFDLKKNKGGAK